MPKFLSFTDTAEKQRREEEIARYPYDNQTKTFRGTNWQIT